MTRKEWKHANPERVKEYRRQYYLKNREKEKQQTEKWRAENAEHVKEYARRYCETHTESRKDFRRNWTEKNRERIQRESADRRSVFRLLIISLKSERPCYDCGGIFPPEALDFDHTRGKKKFQISHGQLRPWDKVREEIDKCQLVCASCHRVRTYARVCQKKIQ